MYEVLHSVELAVDGVGLVTGDLSHPVSIRVVGDAAAPDFPAGDILEEKYMLAHKAMRGEKLVCEEVRGGEDIPVRVEEPLPVSFPVPVRGQKPLLLQDSPDPPFADLVAEIAKLACHSFASPGGILPGKPDDQVDDRD